MFIRLQIHTEKIRKHQLFCDKLSQLIISKLDATAIMDGEAKGIAKGRAEGLAEGEAIGKAQTAKAMKNKEMDPALISELTSLTLEQIQAL